MNGSESKRNWMMGVIGVLTGVVVGMITSLIAINMFNIGYGQGREADSLEDELHAYQLSCAAQESAIEQQVKFIEVLRIQLNDCITRNNILEDR